MNTPEVWKDIQGWPYYQVSNLGRIRVLSGGKIGNHLVTDIEFKRLTPDKNGYLVVKYNYEQFYVHIIVLNIFCGPCPSGMECRHLNGNKTDNRWPENLEWGTRQQNAEDRTRHGTVRKGENVTISKLREADIINIRSSQWSSRQLATKYGVSHTTILRVRDEKTWKHVPREDDASRKMIRETEYDD
jgi:hypothetical protein